MKNLFLVFFLSASVVASAQTNSETIADFLDGVIDFQEVEINEHNPVITVDELAAQQANETMSLTGDNVSDVLQKAKDFTNTLIVVGNHTAVLITDWENCAQSGAWGECMPYGEGFVKRAELEKLTDHINNIIGIPDGQERKVYLFGE